MTDPTSAETATRWLLTVYTNELNWLFCWSYAMIKPAPYHPPTETFQDRLSRWWSAIKSPESRKAHLYAPVTKRKYYAFYVSMTFIVLLRLMLNFAGFFLVIYAIRDFAPSSTDYSESANLPYQCVPRHARAHPVHTHRCHRVDRYTLQTFHALATHRLAKIGGWCLLASTGLHVVAYTMHRYHLVRLLQHGDTSEGFSTPAYWFGHIGLINWILDVPGFRVPTVGWVHILIFLINVTAGLVFFCAYYFQEPVTLAWGCYAPGTPVADLKCVAPPGRGGKHTRGRVVDSRLIPGTVCVPRTSTTRSMPIRPCATSPGRGAARRKSGGRTCSATPSWRPPSCAPFPS